MKARTDLLIEGMTCEGCVRSIEMKLSGVEGVSYAHVNLGMGKVTVDFDDQRTDVTKLMATVNQLGFKAAQA